MSGNPLSYGDPFGLMKAGGRQAGAPSSSSLPPPSTPKLGCGRFDDWDLSRGIDDSSCINTGSGLKICIGPGAITGVSSRLITNAVSGTLARVLPRDLTTKTLGRSGEVDVFVTNASELRGLTNTQIAEKLTIPELSGGFKVIEFSSYSVQGIASPLLRTNPGFVQGGKTAGGAAEFVIPNGPIPAGATQWIPR